MSVEGLLLVSGQNCQGELISNLTIDGPEQRKHWDGNARNLPFFLNDEDDDNTDDNNVDGCEENDNDDTTTTTTATATVAAAAAAITSGADASPLYRWEVSVEGLLLVSGQNCQGELISNLTIDGPEQRKHWDGNVRSLPFFLNDEDEDNNEDNNVDGCEEIDNDDTTTTTTTTAAAAAAAVAAAATAAATAAAAAAAAAAAITSEADASPLGRWEVSVEGLLL